MGTRKERSAGQIGHRISFAWHDRGSEDERLVIEIGQAIAQGKLALLSAWLLLWFGLEAAVLHFWINEPMEGNAWLGYAIYSAFWAFFAFRLGKVWVWRRIGREVITVDRRGVSVAMAFGRRGLPDFFAHGAHGPLSRVEEQPTQILRTFEQAFWSMGGETLQFKGGRRMMVFGKQLPDKDADGLLRLLGPALDRLSRKSAST